MKGVRPDIVKKVTFTVFLLFAGLFCCCLLMEGGVRLLYPRFANYNLEMWRYIATVKKPTRNPRLPFVHYPGRRGVYYGVEVQTNRMGFRGPEIDLDKPEGVTRVLMVGDSLVFGWGVSQEETMAHLLEAKLNAGGGRFEVVNLGVGNYNTTMEVELFKERGLPLKPDAVVLVFFVNDPEPVPKINPVTYPLRQHSYLSAVLFDSYQRIRTRWDARFNWLDYYSGLYRADAPALGENRQALAELAKLCRERGIALYFVSYPELHQLDEYPLGIATRHIEGMARETGTPFLDLLPAFQGNAPETLWVSPEDAHGNAKAAALAAEAIYREFGPALREPPGAKPAEPVVNVSSS